DDAAIGCLRLEMEWDRRPTQRQRADDRVPVRSVRPDAHDAPAGVVQALRLERTEDDAAVLEDDRMQRLADVHEADLLDVGAVVIHHEKLQRDCGVARRLEAVAIADEGDPAAGQRARVHVVDPFAWALAALPLEARGPIGHAGIYGPLLPR